MAVKEILKMGNVRLLDISKPIDNVPSEEINTLVQDMLDTMEAYNGAGLAAPQIGVLKRLVVFGMKDKPNENERYPDADFIPLTILINPKIQPLDDNIIENWEGCLSIPGMRGLVPRHSKIRYSGLDPNGYHIEREVEGFHAIVVQHECDHLDGILYPVRIEDMRCFGFEDELSQPSHCEQDDKLLIDEE